MRLSCEGGDFLNTLFASTKDFAQRRGDRGASTLVVRLRRGDLVVASLVVDGKDVAARVAWPGQAAGPTVAEAWRSSGGGRVVVPTDPEPIPLPSTPSSRPRPGDWLAATPVNTAPPGRRAASCASLVLHDWLHWACSGVGVSVRQSEGLGVAGSDSFQTVGFELAEGDVRLRPGMKASLTIRLTVDGPVAKLQVNWPANEPKPTEISFETAPN